MTPDPANAVSINKSWNTPVDFLVGGSPVELYFSPTDGTTAAIQAEIEAANANFEFALLTLTRDDLGSAIVELNQSFFVSPVGVIEQVNTTGSEFDNLISNGVQAYAHDISGDCHHKYCIIDHSDVSSDPMVITGSHNWSSSAENVNDENTVIVHDARVANLYHQEFRGILNAINGGGDDVRETGLRTWTVMPNPAREQAWVQGLSTSDAVTLLDASGREVNVSVWRQGAVAQLELGGLAVGITMSNASANGICTTTRLAVQ